MLKDIPVFPSPIVAVTVIGTESIPSDLDEWLAGKVIEIDAEFARMQIKENE